MVEVSTSILNLEKDKVIKTLYNLEVAHTDYIHIDIMDGKFVMNNNLRLMEEYAIIVRQILNTPLDLHFMTYSLKDNINQYIGLEPNIITFHIEAVKSKDEVKEIINYIKENDIRVGIAISPETDVKEIYEFLPYIHMVLIMTVEPGLGGQKLILSTIDKVKELKEYIENNNIEIDIEVDGGIDAQTSRLVKEAGANILVAGSAILKSEDYKEIISELKE